MGRVCPIARSARSNFSHLALCVSVVAFLFGFATARADLVHLKWGGELRGTVVDGGKQDPQITVNTLTGGTLVMARTDVEFVRARSAVVEEYITRSRTIPHTAAAHWELAEWCKEKGLKTQRTEQLEAVVAVEPSNVEVHKTLGHIQYKGRWMPFEDKMAATGYFKHKGQWITQQELDLMEKTATRRAAEGEWYTKVKQALLMATGRNPARREEGAAQLLAVRDPDAILALQSLMADHKDPEVRGAFVSILGKIPGNRPVEPLARRALHDEDRNIRSAALTAIKPERYKEAMTPMIAGLLDKDNVVVRRAGLALEQIGDAESAPYLFDALVTSHRTYVPVARQGTTFSTVNGTTSSGGGNLPPNLAAAAQMGLVKIDQPNTTLYDMVPVRVDVKNEEIRQALKSLCGQDFGYDDAAWRNWWRVHKHSSRG